MATLNAHGPAQGPRPRCCQGQSLLACLTWGFWVDQACSLVLWTRQQPEPCPGSAPPLAPIHCRTPASSECRALRGAAGCAGLSAFEGGHHYCCYPYHSLASGQPVGREHCLSHQQKIGLKIYLRYCSPEQEADSPQPDCPHKETSTSLLSLSIREQTQ